MANLLGDLWSGGEPDWAAACRSPRVKLHLYGKVEPRPGRKMGHLTALAPTVEEAERLVVAARERGPSRGMTGPPRGRSRHAGGRPILDGGGQAGARSRL